jgi:hypothetical protein
MAFKASDCSPDCPNGDCPDGEDTADTAQAARGKHVAPNFAAKAEHDSGSLKVALGKQEGGNAPQQLSAGKPKPF